MGASLAIIGFSDKIKTAQQALKDANDRGEQDRYENGHSYSGTMGMLYWRVVNRVFDTVEDFEKMFDDGGAWAEKGDGYIAQVRVIRETKPFLKVKTELWHARQAVQMPNWARPSKKPLTPAQMRRAQAKLEKVEAKYRKLLAAQLAKSTKTKFIGGGWCSS